MNSIFSYAGDSDDSDDDEQRRRAGLFLPAELGRPDEKNATSFSLANGVQQGIFSPARRPRGGEVPSDSSARNVFSYSGTDGGGRLYANDVEASAPSVHSPRSDMGGEDMRTGSGGGPNRRSVFDPRPSVDQVEGMTPAGDQRNDSVTRDFFARTSPNGGGSPSRFKSEELGPPKPTGKEPGYVHFPTQDQWRAGLESTDRVGSSKLPAGSLFKYFDVTPPRTYTADSPEVAANMGPIDRLDGAKRFHVAMQMNQQERGRAMLELQAAEKIGDLRRQRSYLPRTATAVPPGGDRSHTFLMPGVQGVNPLDLGETPEREFAQHNRTAQDVYLDPESSPEERDRAKWWLQNQPGMFQNDRPAPREPRPTSTPLTIQTTDGVVQGSYDPVSRHYMDGAGNVIPPEKLKGAQRLGAPPTNPKPPKKGLADILGAPAPAGAPASPGGTGPYTPGMAYRVKATGKTVVADQNGNLPRQ